ncbi:hypothetical protein LTR85_008291 [Meristemomyces frigidus]|nr:hypothetical protein LTR85_008291 [Meristemomyces frigidus]
MSQTLIAEHRTCIHASDLQHDQDGFVIFNPTFLATVKILGTDPVVQTFQTWQSPAPRVHPNIYSLEHCYPSRLQAYVNYKRKAHADGEPVLTLSELEATGWSEHSTTGDQGVLDYSASQMWLDSPFERPPLPLPVTQPSPAVIGSLEHCASDTLGGLG